MAISSKLVVGLTSLVVVFFIFLSIPLNLATALNTGVENTTAFMTALYIILASIVFVVIFRSFR